MIVHKYQLMRWLALDFLMLGDNYDIARLKSHSIFQFCSNKSKLLEAGGKKLHHQQLAASFETFEYTET